MSGCLTVAAQLASDMRELSFADPVSVVYNTLDYAWSPHATYLSRFATSPKRVLFLGMNPGPFGMAQTGIPFGDITFVRDWLRISDSVGRPPVEHEKKPVLGMQSTRAEVSGTRLWGLMAQRFGTANSFFTDHMVMNYCPLLFLDHGGRNLTPDKLPKNEREPLFAACDKALGDFIRELRPEWVVGVGRFAQMRATAVCNRFSGAPRPPQVARILHPSPASPAANAGWAEAATRQLVDAGIWQA